jgi:hypothetical protein
VSLCPGTYTTEQYPEGASVHGSSRRVVQGGAADLDFARAPCAHTKSKKNMQNQGPYSEGKIPQKSRQKNSTDKNSDGLLCTVHPSPYIIWELSAALSALFQSLLAALGCLWWLCIVSCIILSYQTRSLRDFAVSWGPV